MQASNESLTNSNAESKNHPKEPQLHVVLDLDDMLVTSVLGGLAQNESYAFLKRLREEDFIPVKVQDMNDDPITLTLHILHPGALEFIQYLFTILKARVSFFSSGIEARNNTLVHELLLRALGTEFYEAIKDTISIFSRQDLSPVSEEAMNLQYKHFGLCAGRQKKNLEKTVKSREEINSTILIDDELTYIYPGQEKNILASVGPTVHPNVFDVNRWEQYRPSSDLYQLNHLFYTMGMLKKARVQTTADKSLISNLFNLQFEPNGLNCHKINYEQLIEDPQLYLDGLLELQKINPKLTFYPEKQATAFFNDRKLGEVVVKSQQMKSRG